MEDTQQILEIAKIAGLGGVYRADRKGRPAENGSYVFYYPEDKVRPSRVPSYLTDLNAVLEVARKYHGTQKYTPWANNITAVAIKSSESAYGDMDITDVGTHADIAAFVALSTARMHCEAILKTEGKWESPQEPAALTARDVKRTYGKDGWFAIGSNCFRQFESITGLPLTSRIANCYSFVEPLSSLAREGGTEFERGWHFALYARSELRNVNP